MKNNDKKIVDEYIVEDDVHIVHASSHRDNENAISTSLDNLIEFFKDKPNTSLLHGSLDHRLNYLDMRRQIDIEYSIDESLDSSSSGSPSPVTIHKNIELIELKIIESNDNSLVTLLQELKTTIVKNNINNIKDLKLFSYVNESGVVELHSSIYFEVSGK